MGAQAGVGGFLLSVASIAAGTLAYQVMAAQVAHRAHMTGAGSVLISRGVHRVSRGVQHAAQRSAELTPTSGGWARRVPLASTHRTIHESAKRCTWTIICEAR